MEESKHTMKHWPLSSVPDKLALCSKYTRTMQILICSRMASMLVYPPPSKKEVNRIAENLLDVCISLRTYKMHFIGKIPYRISLQIQ